MPEEEDSTSLVEELEESVGMRGKEVSRSSEGLGRKEEGMSGPNNEPKLLQVYHRRDGKPKKQRVTSLKESGMIKASYREGISSGQNWEAIASKNILLGMREAHQSRFVELSTASDLGKAATILMADRGENARESR